MKILVIVLAVFLAPAVAHAEDNKLVGKWESVDQPGKLAEFDADGVFMYVYAPQTVLQIAWKAGWFSKVTLSMANGANPHSCRYAIDGDELTLDDGAGNSCLPHVKMAQQFKRAK